MSEKALLERSKAALERVLSRPQDIEATARDMFKQADLDGDGTINQDELQVMMKEIMAGWDMDVDSMDESAFTEAFRALDKDGNGKIDQVEFVPFVKQFLDGSLKFVQAQLDEL